VTGPRLPVGTNLPFPYPKSIVSSELNHAAKSYQAIDSFLRVRHPPKGEDRQWLPRARHDCGLSHYMRIYEKAAEKLAGQESNASGAKEHV
jgi:hypothetical protein